MREGSLTFSIVIEWENARLSELGLAREMLRQLHEQLVEVDYPRPEIIILHDKDNVDAQLIEKVVGEVSGSRAWPADIRIIPTAGLEYYEQKNFGAHQSDADLIIFLDSDVIPERGWLAGLLEAFENPDIQVVAGDTYVSLEGFYNKAFALFWLFALRTEGDGLVRTNNFFANNVAFRRETFEAFGGYPNLPSFRGQCAALSEALREGGVDPLLQKGSRVSHPPPNGLRHFINRALCAGHDQMINRQHGKRRFASLLTPFIFYLYALGRSLKRSIKRHRDVQLGPIGAAGAFGIAACYYTLRFTGALLTLVRPDLFHRHFAI